MKRVRFSDRELIRAAFDAIGLLAKRSGQKSLPVTVHNDQMDTLRIDFCMGGEDIIRSEVEESVLAHSLEGPDTQRSPAHTHLGG